MYTCLHRYEDTTVTPNLLGQDSEQRPVPEYSTELTEQYSDVQPFSEMESVGEYTCVQPTVESRTEFIAQYAELQDVQVFCIGTI